MPGPERPRGLRARLLLAHLVVVIATLGTVLVAVSLVGPGYFAQAMGHRPGDPVGAEMDAATLAAFQDAIRTALLAATVIALAAAVAVSLAVSSRIAGPVTRLAAAARRIAQGHYAERVPATGEGEIGELAGSFNVMAGSLEATERRRLQLVGDVAHELRTPLTTLDGYLEGLEDGVVEPTAETWTLLRRETARLTRLVDELQDLWRAEARQLPLRTAPVDAAAIAAEVAARFGPAAAARGIRIVAAPAAAPAVVLADRDRLAQIVGNFVSNAVRYGPDASSVTVGVESRPTGHARAAEVVIAVTDEGPGLTAEQRGQVFERFYRLDPSRSRSLGGSGIGLAIARALAEAMGGRVWAEPAPGGGSRFAVGLPATTAGVRETRQSSPAAPS